jgi:hypothetical protein
MSFLGFGFGFLGFGFLGFWVFGFLGFWVLAFWGLFQKKSLRSFFGGQLKRPATLKIKPTKIQQQNRKNQQPRNHISIEKTRPFILQVKSK